MKIEALMTRDVISIGPDTPLKDVAAILTANHISGAPVCAPDGEVLGVVSEADILRKEQGVSPDVGGRFSWLLRRLDGETDKLTASTAGESMTSPALTVRSVEPAATAARLMIEYGINRLPVVTDGKLVGIVTRADLVRAFHRSDEEIAVEVREDVLGRALWLAPESFELDVRDGVVTLSGPVESERDVGTAEHLIRCIPGVVDVSLALRPRTTRPKRDRTSFLDHFPR